MKVAIFFVVAIILLSCSRHKEGNSICAPQDSVFSVNGVRYASEGDYQITALQKPWLICKINNLKNNPRHYGYWVRLGLLNGEEVIEFGYIPTEYESTRTYTVYSQENKIIMKWGSKDYNKYVEENVINNTFKIIWVCYKVNVANS